VGSINVSAILALVDAQLGASKASTDGTAVLLREAELNFERVTRLASEQIASQSDLDESKARVDWLKARLHRLSAEIEVAARQGAMRR
jgi:multidrug resistance efflux pump